MERRVDRLAAALARRLGIGRGERVAFLGYNSPLLLELLFACARLGAVLVPLNWRLTVAEHRHIVACTISITDAYTLTGALLTRAW